MRNAESSVIHGVAVIRIVVWVIALGLLGGAQASAQSAQLQFVVNAALKQGADLGGGRCLYAGQAQSYNVLLDPSDPQAAVWQRTLQQGVVVTNLSFRLVATPGREMPYSLILEVVDEAGTKVFDRHQGVDPSQVVNLGPGVSYRSYFGEYSCRDFLEISFSG